MASNNKLAIYISKTHYMGFYRARLRPTKEVMIKQNCTKKSTKFLEIIIDDELKWTAHINYIKTKFINPLVYFSRSDIILINIH